VAPLHFLCIFGSNGSLLIFYFFAFSVPRPTICPVFGAWGSKHQPWGKQLFRKISFRKEHENHIYLGVVHRLFFLVVIAPSAAQLGAREAKGI
jgi:hypothetical protein